MYNNLISLDLLRHQSRIVRQQGRLFALCIDSFADAAAVPISIETRVEDNVDDWVGHGVDRVEGTVALLSADEVQGVGEQREKLGNLQRSQVSLPPKVRADGGAQC